MKRAKHIKGLILENSSCFGVCNIVAALVHLLFISFTTKQLQLINIPLCYLK